MFETYKKYLVTLIVVLKKSKQKNKKLLTFFSVANFGLVEPKSGWFWHVWNIFVKIFGVNLEYFKRNTFIFRQIYFSLTVRSFYYIEWFHNSLIMVLKWVSYNNKTSIVHFGTHGSSVLSVWIGLYKFFGPTMAC